MAADTLTFSQHAHLLALAESTFLALPSHVHVHLTVSPAFAFVHSILCDAPSEETWTSQIRLDSIIITQKVLIHHFVRLQTAF